MSSFTTHNPATGSPLRTWTFWRADQIEEVLGLLDDGWHKRHPLDGERKERDPCIQVQTVRERLAGAADVGESCAKQHDERNREKSDIRIPTHCSIPFPMGPWLTVCTCSPPQTCLFLLEVSHSGREALVKDW